MAVRRLKNSITVSGNDLNDVKKALRSLRKTNETECKYCGGHGYLGVYDELCGCGQSKEPEPERIPTLEEKKKNAEVIPF